MARLPDFDEHFKDIRKAQRRMLWMAPLVMSLNAVISLGSFAAAVFIVLALLRYFSVI